MSDERLSDERIGKILAILDGFHECQLLAGPQFEVTISEIRAALRQLREERDEMDVRFQETRYLLDSIRVFLRDNATPE